MEIHPNRRIEDFLDQGVREGVFPGAILLIAREGEIVFQKETGFLSLIPEKIPMSKDTIFDLASLTKPLATGLALMKLVSEGIISLDSPLSVLVPVPFSSDKRDVTPRMLLNHSGGFTAWKPFYLDLARCKQDDRKGLLREQIISGPLEYQPGKGCLYSDLGFMLLEWIIEEVSGDTLKGFVENNFIGPLSLKKTFLYNGSLPPGFEKRGIAATEECAWRKRVVHGEVHDENAFALGGFSGHAGLFADAEDVFKIVNVVRAHYFGHRKDYFNPEIVREFFRRQELIRDCTYALGWDTPSLHGSSSGRHFSSNSVGHLGFSGTSVWMDLDKDIIVVFLTNRIHPTRDNQRIKEFRPAIHDLIMEEMNEK